MVNNHACGINTCVQEYRTSVDCLALPPCSALHLLRRVCCGCDLQNIWIPARSGSAGAFRAQQSRAVNQQGQPHRNCLTGRCTPLINKFNLLMHHFTNKRLCYARERSTTTDATTFSSTDPTVAEDNTTNQEIIGSP